MSCGLDPPTESYRWKHRKCTKCAEALKRRGYITYAGYQVQANLEVPTCYPGMVSIQGEERPPKKKKWDAVQLNGAVEIDWTAARVRAEFGDRPKRFSDFEKRDLDKLRTPPPKFRITHTLAGIACSGARPMVSRQSAYNQAKALCGRVFLEKTKRPWGEGPCPGVWDWAWQFVDELLPAFETQRMTDTEWLDSMPGVRRRVLRLAMARYRGFGWQKSYEKFKAFVKTELLPGFGKAGGDLTRDFEMMDRIIQGPHDVTHCIAGPWLKPLVKLLKAMWTGEYIHYGSCGPESLHRYLQRLLDMGDGLYFWCDFTGFDTTHSRDTWAFMERLYRRAGVHDPDFWRVMEAWRAPAGRIGPFRYKAGVMNASGRDDTALANGVLNGFATFLSVTAAVLKKPLRLLTLSDVRSMRGVAALSVCGDDSLGKVPPIANDDLCRFRDEVSNNIAKFGFEAKLEVSRDIGDAVYLGQRPYPTRKGWFWGKTIGRSTYKMGWVIDKGQDVMAHLTGIADMHVLCSSHVPVLSDLAKKIVELRQGAKRTPPELDPNKPWMWTYQSGVDYDDITIAHVARVYSKLSPGLGDGEDYVVTPSDVRDLIEEIKGVRALPCVVGHRLWRRMIYADDL